MSDRMTGYPPEWMTDILVGWGEGARRFGRAALLMTAIFGPYLLPQAEETRPAISVNIENFNPDMGMTYGQYSRADWVDCVEEPHGHAAVTLPSGDGRAVVGIVGELVMDSTGTDMPMLSDGATIEQRGEDVLVTPMWEDPQTVRPEVATRIDLSGDNWLHIGTAVVFGREQPSLTLYCSPTPN